MLKSVFSPRLTRWGVLLLGLGVFISQVIYPWLFESYTGVTNAPLDYANSAELSERDFERLARDLSEQARLAKASAVVDPDQPAFARQVKVEMLMQTPSVTQAAEPSHIKYFREADIRRYDGPETCLRCHAEMRVDHADGSHSTVDTLQDVVESVHFKFQSDAGGFSTYGYDGREVNAEGERHIPVGKINRACGIPGSFSWTGWAALIESRPEHADGEVVLRSEGCGQCHIGGNYHPPTEKMMPVGDVPGETKNGIDCLICHSAEYDMNQRYVIRDAQGLRWNQDRSLRAALSVGHVANENCLRCHQHNMGGDLYAHNAAAQALGEHHPRLLHHGAKRANPFSPADDVHAAAGILCTDCHVPEGHKIPRGRFGVDLVANDLPGREVSCESCHGRAPHNASEHKALLNGHIARLACESCHIPELEAENVVLRDWVHPTWNAEEGLWEPTDLYRSGEPGKGFTFLWFNGNGTFLANALGSNPEGKGRYNPLMAQMTRITDPEIIATVRARAEALKRDYPEIDVEEYVRGATDPLSQLSPALRERRAAMIEANLREVMNSDESRIYPFKLFNAMMYEDLNNQGPFGAMILPFDYATYHESGESRAAVIEALRHPIIERMYQTPFKLYMMDEFMAYFGVEDGWKTRYPLAGEQLIEVEPRWMRQMGTLMLNHGIQREGHTCRDCHSPEGIMDFRALGYDEEQAARLEHLDAVDLDLDVIERAIAE